jgi:UDP-GlcNAc:undecaprenyl-phosphate GlcNAc-1-phosphate transferase
VFQSIWTEIVGNHLLFAGAKALVVSILLTPILRDVFRSYNIVDRPGKRRVHRYPIPRIGGIPIAIAYAVALFPLNDSGTGSGLEPVWKLLPGASVIFLTGLLDDLFGLSPWVKLGGQITAALLVFYNGLSLGTLGSQTPLPAWLDLPLTVFWVLLTSNALNLIDGLDGLCAGIGLLASGTLFFAALLYGNQSLAYATLPLACALLGFLCYNMNPATVFLGDSGALLIGFLLGCYGMIWTQKTSTMLSLLVPLFALSVPLLDVSVAIVRRLLSHQPIFSADRAHIHHRLLDRGLSTRTAVLILYSFAATASGLALLLIAPQLAPFRNALLVLIVAAFGVGLRQLRYKEFDFIGKILFGGELQKNLQESLRLDKLRTNLEAARTEEEAWMALVESARECGWSRISWNLPNATRDIRLDSRSEQAWRLMVALGDRGNLQIEGQGSQRGVDLADFAETVRSAVRASDAAATRVGAG